MDFYLLFLAKESDFCAERDSSGSLAFVGGGGDDLFL